MRRKRKGTMVDFLPPLLLVVAMLILMMNYLYIVRTVDYKDDVKQIAREYILRMETEGYLTPADKAALEAKLASLGVTGVSLSGTTTSDVGYGNRIVLKVSCSVPSRSPDASGGLLGFLFKDQQVPVSVTLESTAKN